MTEMITLVTFKLFSANALNLALSQNLLYGKKSTINSNDFKSSFVLELTESNTCCCEMETLCNVMEFYLYCNTLCLNRFPNNKF